MADMITHLVVGEHVFRDSGRFGPEHLGPFLLGCVLVDVHFCDRAVERSMMHFSGGNDSGRPDAYDRSCGNFLQRLDGLLEEPFLDLPEAEQAFVAGYLCHLAGDEAFLRAHWALVHERGPRWWRELSARLNVVLSAFGMLSAERLCDPAAVRIALTRCRVPDVFTHVSRDVLESVWAAFRQHAMHRTIDSYLEMVAGMGRTREELDQLTHDHDEHMDAALGIVRTSFGGVVPRMQAMERRSLDLLPSLWGR